MPYPRRFSRSISDGSKIVVVSLPSNDYDSDAETASIRSVGVPTPEPRAQPDDFEQRKRELDDYRAKLDMYRASLHQSQENLAKQWSEYNDRKGLFSQEKEASEYTLAKAREKLTHLLSAARLEAKTARDKIYEDKRALNEQRLQLNREREQLAEERKLFEKDRAQVATTSAELKLSLQQQDALQRKLQTSVAETEEAARALRASIAAIEKDKRAAQLEMAEAASYRDKVNAEVAAARREIAQQRAALESERKQLEEDKAAAARRLKQLEDDEAALALRRVPVRSLTKEGLQLWFDAQCAQLHPIVYRTGPLATARLNGYRAAPHDPTAQDWVRYMTRYDEYLHRIVATVQDELVRCTKEPFDPYSSLLKRMCPKLEVADVHYDLGCFVLSVARMIHVALELALR